MEMRAGEHSGEAQAKDKNPQKAGPQYPTSRPCTHLAAAHQAVKVSDEFGALMIQSSLQESPSQTDN